MAINAPFFLDAASLDLATSVYLDSGLVNISPDGFYGDGTITRQQSSGLLLLQSDCEACGAPCGTSIGGSGGSGVYMVNLNVGSTATGAIIITFNPAGVPDGIRGTYDGIVYNKLSSPVYGGLQSSNYGHYTIIGSTGSVGGCGDWYPSGATLTQPEFLYDPLTSTFTATGGTATTVISTTDFFIESGTMGNCIMVIPKPNTTPSTLLIEIIGPCSSTAWTFAASCPAALPSFASSARLVTYPGPILCSMPMDQTYYYAKVNTASPTEPIGKDYVFTDANGEFPLPDGYYVTYYDGVTSVGLINVSNGIILNRIFTSCT